MGFSSGISDFFGNVYVNQDLMIRSPKLGMLHRLMQLVLVISIGIYTYYLHVWKGFAVMSPFALSAWAEAPLTQGAADTSVKHCSDPGFYRFLYRGTFATTLYEPSECLAPEGTDGFEKRGDFLMVFTHIVDTVSVRNTNSTSLPDQCSDASEDACRAMKGLFDSNGGNCECKRRHEYFIRNPEELSLHFMHGYAASRPLGGVERKRQGEPGMITVFKKPDGSSCQINGRTIVRDTDMTPAGINGTFREFLACAGVSLDDGPAQLGHGDTILRTMGVRLELELKYSNVDREYDAEVVCFVTPHIHVAWTASYDYEKILYAQPIGAQSSQHSREAYGILVQFTVESDLRYWSIPAIVQGIVTIFIVMGIPHAMTEFIVETCLGSLSKIYLNAKRTRFDVNEQLRTTIGRSLFPLIIFRGLVGGNFKARGEQLPRMKIDDLEDAMQDVFAEEMKSGELDEQHIHRMVSLLCGQAQAPKKTAGKERISETATIGYADFGVVANRNELLGKDMLVTMVQKNRQKNFLERLLTDHSLPDAGDDQGVCDEESLKEMFRDPRLDEETGSPGKSSSRHKPSLELQEVSPAKSQGAAGSREDDVVPGALEERIRHAEHVAQQAMKGLELALARARASEEKAALIELKLAELQGVRKGQAGPMASMIARLEAAEEAAQQAREEAQAAVFGVEAMRGSVTELERKSGKPEREKGFDTEVQEEVIIEQDLGDQADSGASKKDKDEEKEAGTPGRSRTK